MQCVTKDASACRRSTDCVWLDSACQRNLCLPLGWEECVGHPDCDFKETCNFCLQKCRTDADCPVSNKCMFKTYCKGQRDVKEACPVAAKNEWAMEDYAAVESALPTPTAAPTPAPTWLYYSNPIGWATGEAGSTAVPTAAPTVFWSAGSRTQLAFLIALGYLVVIFAAVAVAAVRRSRRRTPRCGWPVDKARRGRGRSMTYPVDKKGDVAEACGECDVSEGQSELQKL